MQNYSDLWYDQVLHALWEFSCFVYIVCFVYFLHRIQIVSEHAPVPSSSWLIPAGLHQDDPRERWSLEVLSQHWNRDDYNKAWKVTALATALYHLSHTQPTIIMQMLQHYCERDCDCTYFTIQWLIMTLCTCFRRMFPHCSISLSGLQPFANYVIMMDMVPADSFKYKVNS